MRLLSRWILLLILVLVACRPEPEPLPTLVQFPTMRLVTPTAEATMRLVTATPQAVGMAEMTFPPSFTPSQTNSIEVSQTPNPEIILPTNTPTLRPIIPTSTANASPFPVLEETRYSEISFDEALDLLRDTPDIVLPLEHTSLIFERGQQRGLRSDFLLSVGDCNSESHFYLRDLLDDTPPSDGVDMSYYESPDVQSTISRYSEAFDFKGQSVNSGLNSLSVMDPFWASPDVCPAGESPLSCDYRFTHPFASLIMFGANDINVLSTADYERALRDIIEFTMERDIIPILSTFTVRPMDDGVYPHAVRFNGVIVRLAEEYQIPLVNFWRATRNLPDNGILSDNAHLTVAGFNIRNQLTIEMLNALRQELMLESANS